MPLRQRLGHRMDGRAAVLRGERVHQERHRFVTIVDATGGDHLVERRERVAGRPPPGAHHVRHGLVGEVEARVGVDPPDVVLEFGSGQEAELEVLRATADGGQDLVRVGGGQHETHTARRFLERLQEGVRRAGAEHVHLVEDVHLRPAGRRHHRAAHEAAHVIDLVVGRGIELEEVEAVAGLHGDARIALTARFTVAEVLTVERFRQDAGRGRLTRAARPREQVGVPLGAGPHGVAHGGDDVVLAPYLTEGPRSIPAVEGGCGHGASLVVRSDSVGRNSAAFRAPPACVLRWRPGDLRHTAGSAESCCLPALTRFTGHGRTGPGRRLRTHAQASGYPEHALARTVKGLGSPNRGSTPGEVRERTIRHAWNACVAATSPWVRIPPSPP